MSIKIVAAAQTIIPFTPNFCATANNSTCFVGPTRSSARALAHYSKLQWATAPANRLPQVPAAAQLAGTATDALIRASLPTPQVQPGTRTFIPRDVHLESADQMIGYADELKTRIAHCTDATAYAAIVEDYIYFTSWVDEDVTWAQHNQRQHTQDDAIKSKLAEIYKIYFQFGAIHEEVLRLLGDSEFYPALAQVDPIQYAVFIRMVDDLKAAAEKRDSPERQAWGKAQAAYQSSLKSEVKLNGEDVSITEIGRLLKSNDGAVCRAAWQARATAYQENLAAADAATTDALNQLWALSGEATPLQWLEGETGYSAQQARDLLDVLQVSFVPLFHEIVSARRGRLGLAEADFMPWHLQATPAPLKPLRAYRDEAELRQKAIALAYRIHPGFGALTQHMFETGLISTDSRPDKSSRPYFAPFLLSGKSVISLVASTTPASLNGSTMHELGHAWHARRSADTQSSSLNGVAGFDHLRGPAQAPLETFSVIMEALSELQSDIVYDDPADQARAREEQAFSLVNVVLRQCVVAEYELWLYSSKEALDQSKRSAYYIECLKKYGLHRDNWESLSEEIAAERLDQVQDAVLKPMTGLWFYGVNKLAAIQVMQSVEEKTLAALQALKDAAQGTMTEDEMLKRAKEEGLIAAVDQLLPAMDSGATLGFEETWKLAGLSTDFSVEKIHQLADTIRAQLG